MINQILKYIKDAMLFFDKLFNMLIYKYIQFFLMSFILLLSVFFSRFLYLCLSYQFSHFAIQILLCGSFFACLFCRFQFLFAKRFLFSVCFLIYVFVLIGHYIFILHYFLPNAL